MENPKVDKCFGIHLLNKYYYPFGGTTLKEGLCSANTDMFFIDIEGVGSHAMNP